MESHNVCFWRRVGTSGTVVCLVARLVCGSLAAADDEVCVQGAATMTGAPAPEILIDPRITRLQGATNGQRKLPGKKPPPHRKRPPHALANPPPYAETLRRALLAMREERGLSRPVVAERAGVDRTQLWRYETGRAPWPDIYTLIKLANFYHCSLDDLVGRTVPRGKAPRITA